MKKRNILTAVAMTLGLSAWAGSWDAPTLEGTDPVDGDIVYLQNTATGQFLAGGNGWNTQASISTTGLLFELVQEPTSEGTMAWAIKNQRSDKFGQYLFAEGVDRSFIDMGNQNESHPDCNYWNFFKQEDGTYRIQLVPSCEFFGDECYFGWMPEGINWQSGTTTTTAVYPSVYAEENPGAGINWKFISQEAYANIPATYYARLDLYAKLNEAESKEVEIPADILAIYNNANATNAELQDATDALAQLIFKANLELWGEADITNEYLNNPAFDQNEAGWVGTTGESWWNADAFHINPNTFANDKDNITMSRFVCRYIWSGEWLGFLNNEEVSQKVNLPAGRYRLECDGIALNEGNGEGSYGGEKKWTPGTGFYVFAKTSLGEERAQILTELQSETEKEFVPDKIPGHFSVDFLSAGGEVQLGVKLVDAKCNWAGADNFKLFCKSIINSPRVVELAVMQNDLSKYVDNYDDAFFSATTLAKTEEFIDNCDDPIDAENVPVCVEMYEQGKALVELINDEIAAYKLLNEVYETANKAIDEATYEHLGEEAVNFLNKYIEKAGDSLGDFAVTAEEARALVDEYYAGIAKYCCAYVNNIGEGMDVSGLMRNAGFWELTNSWYNGNGSALLPGWEGTRPWDYDRGCIRLYNGDFDTYQTIKSVPAGVYTLVSRGYYRWGSAEETAESINTPTENRNNTSCLYMNDVKVPLHLWSDGMAKGVDAGGLGNGQFNTNIQDADGDDQYLPNSLWFFADGHAPADSCYVNICPVIITEDGSPLRIGVAAKGEHSQNDLYVKSMNLRYEGNSAAALQAAFTPILDEMKRKIEKVYSFMPLSKELYNLPETLKTEADAIIATGDMKKCSDCLVQMAAKLKEVDEMLAVAGQLKESWDYYEYNLLQDASSAEFTAQFDALPELLKGGCTPWDTNEEMIKANHDFNALFVAGLQQKGANASLDNPHEMSLAIRTADFYDNLQNATSAIYWQGVGEGSKVEEQELEFYNVPEFNLYQVIPGLPKGYYRLTVQGFYRGGETLASNLYAQIGDDVWQNPLMSIQSAEGYENVTNMATAQEAFVDGKYLGNKVEFSVDTESADVTIGVKKSFDYPTDWTVVDRFQLFYLGQTSPDAIQSMAGMKASGAVYNLAGQRVDASYKGIVIKNGKKYIVK